MRIPGHRKLSAGLAAVVSALLMAGPLSGTASAQVSLAPTLPALPQANPLAGDGMWIWYVKRSNRGKVGAIAKRARKRGMEVVLIKSGDGTKYWSQFTSRLVGALHARGLKVCAWQFVYGRSPSTEASVGAQAKARGADCLVIDAEGHYEGRYPEASTYMSSLRAQVGPDYPIGLAAFPYVDYHPAFPYSVFLGPGGAQYNLPQLYWKTIGTSVDTAFTHTYVFNRAYGRPILPLGQVYLSPSKAEIRRFRSLAVDHQMPGVSWWSWQSAGKRQWKAVGGSVGGAGVLPYNSYPLLRLNSKGDLVAWAQQLLAGGGFSTPITGYYLASTQAAVQQFQASKGITQTGNIDVPTWDQLIQNQPLAVRWTTGGAVAASSGGRALPPPASASLPAKRNEIPPPAKRDPAHR